RRRVDVDEDWAKFSMRPNLYDAAPRVETEVAQTAHNWEHENPRLRALDPTQSGAWSLDAEDPLMSDLLRTMIQFSQLLEEVLREASLSARLPRRCRQHAARQRRDTAGP